MKWKEQKRSLESDVGMRVERVLWVLSKLEPHLVASVSQNPVLASDEKETLIDKFREVRERLTDGYSRFRQTVVVENGTESVRWKTSDVSLLVKLEQTESDLQFFVSLGLHAIEKLFVTNHLTEEKYKKYKRILRFLPRLHATLIARVEGATS